MSPLTSTALHALFEALSHFDAATHGEVVYREEPFGPPDHEGFWSKSGWFYLSAAGIQNDGTEYSVPDMFHQLSDADCWKVISFVENHRESFWALDAMRGAVVDQALDSRNRKHLVSNVNSLWDESTNRVQSLVDHGDCYSYRVIRGLPDVEISALTPEDKFVYRALVHFAVVSYNRSHCTISSSSAPVREYSYENMIRVQEPYLSIVMQYPRQLEIILRWTELYEGRSNEIDQLVELLQQEHANSLVQGML